MDETRVTGDLPNMRVEITHGTDATGKSEYMTIQLTATPDFRAALPLLGQFAPMPMMLAAFQGPLATWQAAVQAMMAPWAQFAGATPFPPLSRGSEGDSAP